jgi:protein-histidine pros-kinase
LIELSVDIDPSPADVGADAQLALFRVTQEALNNVVRHASAHAASVSLRKIDNGLMLAVRDDGIGFDPAHSSERKHLGLASMRERMQLVGGSLDIDSVPGQGTTILAWVPPLGAAP